MERRGDKVDIVQRVSCWISDMAFARFKSFSDLLLYFTMLPPKTQAPG